MKDETEENQYEEGVFMKTLGEVCKDISTSKNIPSSNRVDGTYRFFTCSSEETTHNEYHYDGTFIIHGSRGYIKGCVFMTNNEKFAIGTSMFISEVKNKNECIPKYIYYYLRLNQSILSKYINGTAIPMISKSNYYDIKIPIPSLERQQEIVKYLDFIYEKANKTSNEKIAELKQLNAFYLSNQKIFGKNENKKLGEVCSIDYGTRIVKGNNTEGEYPVYGSGRAMFSTNTFNREGYNILIGRFALSLECVRFINVKIFLNDSGLSVKPKTDILLHKYIGHYLLHNQSIIYNCARGTAQKNLEMDIFKSIIIPIPSLERQKEIVEYCEYNDTLIKQLEKEIENNKKQAKQFISSLMKLQESEMEINEPPESDIENEIVS
jgi:restriction endonuclease S subunit